MPSPVLFHCFLCYLVIFSPSYICLSFLVFFLGESSSCQIKASPHALFSCISMCWWALNNIHSQQTFQRARLASYMIGSYVVLSLFSALVFFCREREREVWLFHGPKSSPLCSRREMRYILRCCNALLLTLAIAFLLLPFTFFYFLGAPSLFTSILWIFFCLTALMMSVECEPNQLILRNIKLKQSTERL